jgi:putative redox protein
MGSAVPLDLRSPRGERLAGLRHDPERPDPRGLVLLSPCFTCTRDIAPVRNLARDLADLGFVAVRFDPTGSGKSEGRFEDATVSKYVEDLIAVARTLAPAASPLVLAGHSLGGVVSLLAARTLDPAAVVTLASNASGRALVGVLGRDVFERARREGRALFDPGDGVTRPLTRAFVDDLEQHDPLAAARALDRPLLVFHGDQDEIVPLEAARELARAAPRAEGPVVLPGASHLLSRPRDREEIRAVTSAFLDRVLAR